MLLVPIVLDLLLFVLFLLRKISSFETNRSFTPEFGANVRLQSFLILIVIGSLDIDVVLHAFL